MMHACTHICFVCDSIPLDPLQTISYNQIYWMMQVAKKADEGAQTISEAAGNLKDKAKNTAEEAWDKVKDTTEKIKDTVTGKTEETKESIKAKAKTVEKSMNTKNLK